MHELSIVMSIVDIATNQAEKANAQTIDQIELEIGELSGVEMNSFDFAWKQGIRNSVLSKAELVINRPAGKGLCMDCDTQFDMHRLFDACTQCGGHLVAVQQGKELRVKSLLVS